MENEIRIEAIEKKNKNYLVKTNLDNYLFDEDTLIQHQVSKDKVFSKKEFEQILEDLAVSKNLNRTIQYLRYGMRSIYEIKQYLKEETHLDKVINKLKQLGYIDDQKLAKAKVDYYQRQGKGPLYIQQKLQQIHIDQQTITAALTQYTDFDQQERILKQVEQASIQHQTLPIVKQKQKIYQKLLRDGFHSSQILQAINQTEFVDQSNMQLEKDLIKIIFKYQNKLDIDQLKQKAITILMNKGYGYNQIKEAWDNQIAP